MGIVSDALAYVGKVEYGFGKNDIPGGVGDCSAFTQYIYGLHGYTIGRDTRAQLAWCKKNAKEVDRSQILPGDIVFFQNTYTGRVGVSHVGIATGGGKMVNLQNDGVVHEEIFSTWWGPDFLAAYRFADADDVGNATENSEDVTGGAVDAGAVKQTGLKAWGLDWWGDVITVVLIVGCLGFGLFFIYKAFAAQIKMPDLSSIGKAAAKSTSEGASE